MATKEEITEVDEPEVRQTWQKFERSAKKAGFRDGAADGRNQTYQKSFDNGYIQGFKNGYAIGKYLGVTRGDSLQNLLPVEEDSNLQNSRRGWCQICKDENLLQSTTNEIIHIQTQFSNNLLKEMHSKYSPTTNVVLQNKLE